MRNRIFFPAANHGGCRKQPTNILKTDLHKWYDTVQMRGRLEKTFFVNFLQPPWLAAGKKILFPKSSRCSKNAFSESKDWFLIYKCYTPLSSPIIWPNHNIFNITNFFKQKYELKNEIHQLQLQTYIYKHISFL